MLVAAVLIFVGEFFYTNAAEPIVLPPTDQKKFSFYLIVDYRQTMTVFPHGAYTKQGFVDVLYYNPENQEYIHKIPFMNVPCDESSVYSTTRVHQDRSDGRFIFGDGRHINVVAVNGSQPGPTLVLNQGAEIVMTIKNNLLMEGITVHMHGLKQINNWYMDGVAGLQQCPIPAGSTFTYRFHADNAGTHWYHGHLGSDRSQGVFGPLIVIPSSSSGKQPSFKLNGNTLTKVDDQFVATVFDMYQSQPTDLFHASFWFTLKFDSNLDAEPLGPKECYAYTRTWDGSKTAPNRFTSVVVNGYGWHKFEDVKSKPWNLELEEFVVDRGKSYLFRIINAGMILRYRISIESHKLHVVSSDGDPFEPVAVDYLIVFPGERYDFVISADQDQGFYYIRLETMEIYNDFLNETLEMHYGLALLKYSSVSENLSKGPDWDYPSCNASVPCTVLNCPFASFNASLNLKCVHLQDLVGISDEDKSNVLKDSYSSVNEEYEEHFLNINYYQKVNGWWFVYPTAPPYLNQGNENEVTKPCRNQACPHVYDDCTCTYTIDIKLGNVVQLTMYNEGKGGALEKGIPHPVHIHGYHFYIIKQENCLDPFDLRYKDNCRGGLWETRYFYDRPSKSCRMFWYDGCKRKSRNIFTDLESCQWLCEGTHSKPEAKSCLDKFDPNRKDQCRGGFWEQRFYFDMETKTCVAFYYDGCPSRWNSMNIYATSKVCQELCELPHRDVSRACLYKFDKGYMDTCSANPHQMRYFYDIESKSCRMFWFGHCRAQNENIFPDLATCQWHCERPKSVEPPRPCIDGFDDTYRKSCGAGWVDRYYFDHGMGVCIKFQYGHCHSSRSQNIFPDLKTCQWLCEFPTPPYQPPARVEDTCLQQVDPGSCTRAYPAFFYDRLVGRCKPFSYTGCGGNSNRFLTIQQCERTCRIFQQLTGMQSKCMLPLDVGYGRHDSRCMRRAGYMYYYNRHYRKCGRFWYFGCGGNENKYGTEVECRVTCAHKTNVAETTAMVDPRNCYIDKENGQCVHIDNKPSTRYYYSPSSNKCQAFSYNGCGGNENRFGSLQSCEAACGGMMETKSLICAAWPDWGPCNRLRWMWHFNITTGHCEQFLWGGCEGNLNRFTNFDQCQTTCEMPSGNLCSEPLDRGRWCEAMTFKFYFNSIENRCKGYHYTGCGTSRNRFNSMEDCRIACMSGGRRLRSSSLTAKNKRADTQQLTSQDRYDHEEPAAKQNLTRHTNIGYKTKHYVKTPPLWVDYSQCIGFRYNISGPGTTLRSYLCVMEEGGQCLIETFSETFGLEKCKILRPWLKGSHLYSWFFTLNRIRPYNWKEYKTFRNDTEANVIPLGLNRCWDAC